MPDPRRPQEPAAHFALVPSFETVYGRRPSIADLHESIKQFSLWSWLAGLSRLSLLTDRSPRSAREENDLQLRLLATLFGPIQQTEIRRFLYLHGSGHLRLVHSSQVHTLVQLAFCLAPEAGKDLDSSTDRYLIGRCLLAVNDLFLPEYTGRAPAGVDTAELRAHLVHSHVRSQAEDHWEQVWRLKTMFIERLDDKRVPDWLDVRSVFNRVCSVGIEKAFGLGVFFAGMWEHGFPSGEQAPVVIDASTLDSSAFVTDAQVDEFLGCASVTREDLVRDVLASDAPSSNPELFTFVAFRRHPLVHVGNRYALTSLRFWKEWCTSGLYHLIQNAITSGGNNTQLSRWFGHLFESYCLRLIPPEWARHLVRLVPDETRRGRQFPPDTVLRFGDDLVVVEAKVFRHALAFLANTHDLVAQRDLEFGTRFGDQFKNDFDHLLLLRGTPTVAVRCTFRDTEGVRRSVPAAPLWWERGNGNDDGYNLEAGAPSIARVSGGGQLWSAART